MTVLLLASCAPAAGPVVADALPTVTSTPWVIAAQTSAPTDMPPSPFPSPSPTATQTPCDPFAADFCITEGHFVLQNPILPPGSSSIDPTYRYGSTENGTRDPHHGVEIGKGFGTPVHAAGDGMVLFAGPDREAVYGPWSDFYGNLVVIRHAKDLFTLYAHLSEVNVEAGDEVGAGKLIGRIGQSGAATGPHLHFEVRVGGDGTGYASTQNPELWLAPNKDGNGNPLGVISFAIEDQESNFRSAELTASFHTDRNGPAVTTYYIVTYAKDMMTGEENAALGDLPPGWYRIALTYNGHLYERWVEVESGRLTRVVLVVK